MTLSLGLFVLASALALPPAPFAPALCSSATAAVERPSFASGGIVAKSTCIVDCGDLNGTISCSGATCNAVNQDQSCPATPGHVTCDTQTFYCPACCTNGAIRNVSTGPICSCADGQTSPKDQYKCVNGLWVYQFSFCGGPFCHG